MEKSAKVSAKIDSTLKHNAEKILKQLGISPAQAITMFYKQVELERGLPFDVKIPNEETLQALEDARNRRNLEHFNTLDDLFNDLAQ